MKQLKVHFLNVGRGDCTIIEFPSGRIGMVDIDNLSILDPDTEAEIRQEYREAHRYELVRAGAMAVGLEEGFVTEQRKKLTDPLAYYNAHMGKKDIFRLLITHPDMDHMTGLYRLHEQSSTSIYNFWHTGNHDFNLATCADDAWGPYDKRDWSAYKKLRAGEACTSLQNFKGATGDFWTEDGVEIWAPTPELEQLAVKKQQANIISMILKLTFAGRSIILGGDATADETWPAIYPKIDMKGISVLKASHHGRKTGYYQPAVKEMSPWLTITSVGEIEHDATPNYRRYSDYTVSLRKAGNITITIHEDGKWYYSPDLAPYWKAKLED